jgi:hypothetical protein
MSKKKWYQLFVDSDQVTLVQSVQATHNQKTAELITDAWFPGLKNWWYSLFKPKVTKGDKVTITTTPSIDLKTGARKYQYKLEVQAGNSSNIMLKVPSLDSGGKRIKGSYDALIFDKYGQIEQIVSRHNNSAIVNVAGLTQAELQTRVARYSKIRQATLQVKASQVAPFVADPRLTQLQQGYTAALVGLDASISQLGVLKESLQTLLTQEHDEQEKIAQDITQGLESLKLNGVKLRELLAQAKLQNQLNVTDLAELQRQSTALAVLPQINEQDLKESRLLGDLETAKQELSKEIAAKKLAITAQDDLINSLDAKLTAHLQDIADTKLEIIATLQTALEIQLETRERELQSAEVEQREVVEQVEVITQELK